MLYVDAAGERGVSHNMTRKIVWGIGAQAAAGQLRDLSATSEGRTKRDEMIKVCLTCHAEDNARRYLESADAHKLAGDALVREAREILAGPYRDHLIRPSHGQLLAGVLPGHRSTAVNLPGGMAFHSPASLVYDVSSIEREYFDMVFVSSLTSYKGPFT